MTRRIPLIAVLCAPLFGCPPEPPTITIGDSRVDAGAPADAGMDDAGQPALHPQAQAWLDRAEAGNWRYFRFVERCAPADCRLEGGGWTTRRLFSDQVAEAPDDRVADENVPVRYLLFEWTLPDGVDPAVGRSDAATALSGLDGPVNLETAELFPARVAPLADPDRLRANDLNYWRDFGGVRRMPRRGAPDQVELVVLDTIGPTAVEDLYTVNRKALAEAGRATHGIDLAAAIHEAACGRVDGMNPEPNRDCPITVSTAVALDLAPASREDDPTVGGFEARPEGGHFGDPGGVARAIWDATAAWSERPPAERPALGLVLALGWGVLEDTSPSTAAARLAIDFARCNGALVIPAFGNVDLPDANMRGALRPAAFGAPEQCARLGADGQPAPIITVAGAAWPDHRLGDRQLDPLHNARPWAGIQPAAFAWGDGIRASGGDARWTGSSMAAGMYAAAVAVEWIGLVTEERPAGVIGADLAVESLHARTLDVNALVRPCAAAGGECAVEIPALDVGRMADVPDAVEPPACGPTNQPCGNGLLSERVDPQPDEPICDVCALTQGSANDVMFTLLAKYAAWPAKGDRIYDAYLKVTYTTGIDADIIDLTQLDEIRSDIMTTSEEFVQDGLTLSEEINKIDTVTIIGLKQTPGTSVPVSFYETVVVDP